MQHLFGNLRCLALSNGRGLWGALAVSLLAGCASNSEGEKRQFLRVYTPQMPVFMSGPAAVLLTNNAGFSARVTLRADSAFALSDAVEGELLGRGGKLLFAPRQTGEEDKEMRSGGFTYIWDVASGSGFILSDALQAYAPVSSGLRVTNMVVEPKGEAAREARLFLNDGAQAVFRISPGGARNEFPSRIEAVGGIPLSLSFSRVRLQAPAADLFATPNGFFPYRNPEALADEIAARQHNLRRGVQGYEPFTAPAPPRGYDYGGPPVR